MKALPTSPPAGGGIRRSWAKRSETATGRNYLQRKDVSRQHTNFFFWLNTAAVKSAARLVAVRSDRGEEPAHGGHDTAVKISSTQMIDKRVKVLPVIVILALLRCPMEEFPFGANGKEVTWWV